MLPDYGDAHVAPYAERRFREQWWAIRDHVRDTLTVTHLDPWSDRTAIDIEGLGTVQPMVALRKLQSVGDTYFQGWGGQVVVGPLIAVPGPVAPASTVRAPTQANH